jgi:hypothetical protein
MNRFSALAAITLLSLSVSACGSASTSGFAPTVPQAELQSSAATKLKPIPIKQGLTAEDPQANPKLVRVKKIAEETIVAANKLTAEFNKTGNIQLLRETDSKLVRGLNMMMDVLDGDQDPTSLKAIAVVNAAEAECDKLLEAFEKSFFKTDAKRAKTIFGVLDLRSHAVERLYDLSRVATEK